jgi:hypothetical protein
MPTLHYTDHNLTQDGLSGYLRYTDQIVRLTITQHSGKYALLVQQADKDGKPQLHRVKLLDSLVGPSRARLVCEIIEEALSLNGHFPQVIEHVVKTAFGEGLKATITFVVTNGEVAYASLSASEAWLVVAENEE